VRPERVRGFLLSEQQLDVSLGREADNAAKITLLETLLMDCKDAISTVRDELKADPVSKYCIPVWILNTVVVVFPPEMKIIGLFGLP
jgi:hypothetical protein